MPNDELGSDLLACLTGFNKSFFDNLGKACIVLTLVDDAKIGEIIDDMTGKITQQFQRAICKSSFQALKDEFESYSKHYVFTLCEKHISAGCIAPIRSSIILENM